MSEPLIIASKATVYRVNGKGRGWRSKPAAYRSAALAMLRAACECSYDDHEYGDSTMTEHHTCRLCKRTCETHSMTTTTKKSAADLAFERKVARIAKALARLNNECSGLVARSSNDYQVTTAR